MSIFRSRVWRRIVTGVRELLTIRVGLHGVFKVLDLYVCVCLTAEETLDHLMLMIGQAQSQFIESSVSLQRSL